MSFVEFKRLFDAGYINKTISSKFKIKTMNKLFISVIIASKAAAYRIPRLSQSSDLALNETAYERLAQQDEDASCYRSGINRGVGTMPDSCPFGYVYEGGFTCNAPCNDNDETFDHSCMEYCPSGFHASLNECIKPFKLRPIRWGL